MTRARADGMDEQPPECVDGPLRTCGTPAGQAMIELRSNHPPPAGRGPKQKLSLEQVVRAGMEVATGEGIGKLSMRRVAQHLGVGTMSLYTYVPGRDELFELM